MNAIQRKKTVAHIHFPGSRIPNARRQDRSKALRAGNPTEHHQVRINDLFRVSSLEAQTVCEIDLAGQPMAANRVLNFVIRKNKNCFFAGLPHFQPVIRLASSGNASNPQTLDFDF